MRLNNANAKQAKAKVGSRSREVVAKPRCVFPLVHDPILLPPWKKLYPERLSKRAKQAKEKERNRLIFPLSHHVTT